MRDRSAIGSFRLGPFRVGMNELMIQNCIGEAVDERLIHGNPFRNQRVIGRGQLIHPPFPLHGRVPAQYTIATYPVVCLMSDVQRVEQELLDAIEQSVEIRGYAGGRASLEESMPYARFEAGEKRELSEKEALVEAGRPRRPTRSRRKNGESESADTNVEILDVAAQCFMEMGFQGTSIDDVARRLGATKGRIYHYYRSKTDLFFDVHREGMRRLNNAVHAAMQKDATGRETLHAMLEAHALTMLQNIAYLAVVVQGVHMHRLGATTLVQRQ